MVFEMAITMIGKESIIRWVGSIYLSWLWMIGQHALSDDDKQEP